MTLCAKFYQNWSGLITYDRKRFGKLSILLLTAVYTVFQKKHPLILLAIS